MARWVRDGEAPDKVPVSFVVTKDKHPELVEWLWVLPFRKQSEIIRDLLNDAAKIAYAKPGAAQKAPGKPAQSPADQASPPPAAPAVAPSAGTAMTEATANILRNMRQDF